MPESKGAPAEPHSYRLAVHPDTGAHGYEVGYWPSGADLNDPAAYVVVGRCYSQREAQALAAHHDANPPDHLPPEEGNLDADAAEEPHRAAHASHSRHRK